MMSILAAMMVSADINVSNNDEHDDNQFYKHRSVHRKGQLSVYRG